MPRACMEREPCTHGPRFVYARKKRQAGILLGKQAILGIGLLLCPPDLSRNHVKGNPYKHPSVIEFVNGQSNVIGSKIRRVRGRKNDSGGEGSAGRPARGEDLP